MVRVLCVLGDVTTSIKAVKILENSITVSLFANPDWHRDGLIYQIILTGCIKGSPFQLQLDGLKVNTSKNKTLWCITESQWILRQDPEVVLARSPGSHVSCLCLTCGSVPSVTPSVLHWWHDWMYSDTCSPTGRTCYWYKNVDVLLLL